MGCMSYLFFSDTYKQCDLNQQKEQIKLLKSKLVNQRTASSSYETKKRILLLESENDELRLYIAALTRLLIAKGTIKKDSHRTKVVAIDAIPQEVTHRCLNGQFFFQLSF